MRVLDESFGRFNGIFREKVQARIHRDFIEKSIQKLMSTLFDEADSKNANRI
jgi:hypothetical protein